MVDMTIKGMLWIENYKRVVENKKYLPPIGVALDLTDVCNLKCYYCNAQQFRSSNMLSLEHVKQVIDMLSEMKVKSVCYAGGGEPTLHPNLKDIIEYTYNKGLEVAISTNGLNLNKELIQTIIKYCKFIGISVDAVKDKTWTQIKGTTGFSKVINKIKQLCEIGKDTNVDITYKVLVVPENQYEILDACVKAKELGCKSFFVRPARIEDLSNRNFDVDSINHQIKCCIKLQDENFKVYTNFIRVNEDYSKRNSFSKCIASVVLPVLCADGYVYLCVDHRQDIKYRLCKHLDLIKYWGSKQHRQLIENVNPKECPRCTLALYNEYAEAYFKDLIFKNFP